MNWYHESSSLYFANKPANEKAVKQARARRDRERTRQRIENATAAFWLGIGSIIVVGTLYAVLLPVMA